MAGATQSQRRTAPVGRTPRHCRQPLSLEGRFVLGDRNPFRVILAEYPKYGGRPGKVGEKSFVAAGLETVRLAQKQYREPLYLLGESLGCGVAAAVANLIYKCYSLID